jgi:hypothetical protein
VRGNRRGGAVALRGVVVEAKAAVESARVRARGRGGSDLWASSDLVTMKPDLEEELGRHADVRRFVKSARQRRKGGGGGTACVVGVDEEAVVDVRAGPVGLIAVRIGDVVGARGLQHQRRHGHDDINGGRPFVSVLPLHLKFLGQLLVSRDDLAEAKPQRSAPDDEGPPHPSRRGDRKPPPGGFSFSPGPPQRRRRASPRRWAEPRGREAGPSRPFVNPPRAPSAHFSAPQMKALMSAEEEGDSVPPHPRLRRRRDRRRCRGGVSSFLRRR